jgi:hypothetical protein
MKKLGFKTSLIDPCLLVRINELGVVIFCLYVDDCSCFGHRKAIDDAINNIGKYYKIKKLGKMSEYVGCTVIRSKTENKCWLIQPDLIEKLQSKFKEKISKLKEYKTPAGPGESVIRPIEGDPILSEEEQKEFRSGVGMLLYLVKHSRPDISNVVRELAKVMDGAMPAHQKLLYRTIKYVIDTKDRALVYKPLTEKHNNNFIWHLKAYCDSDYSGDKDKRISVTGFIIYFMGCAISWKSRAQKSVTLSSTEAEYVAISEVSAEIMFIKQLLESLNIQVNLPIIVHVDNVGAIYLSNNATTSQRTKHIDIRYHYVREYIEDGILKILFVKSEQNDADIYTKNLSQDLYYEHSRKYMEYIQE